MHLEHVYCMNDIDLKNKGISKNDLLTSISTTPLNAVENKLSMNSQYDENEYTETTSNGITTNSKEIILQSSNEYLKTSIEKSNILTKNMNITAQHDNGIDG